MTRKGHVPVQPALALHECDVSRSPFPASRRGRAPAPDPYMEGGNVEDLIVEESPLGEAAEDLRFL